MHVFLIIRLTCVIAIGKEVAYGRHAKAYANFDYDLHANYNDYAVCCN